MAYYSGQISSFNDLLNIFVSICQNHGWVWSNSILSKNECYLRLIASETGITATGGTGQSGATLLNESFVMPRLGQPASAVNLPNFPADYHVFIFSDEVYLQLKFNIDYFYYLAFGKSDIPMPEAGLWIIATSCEKLSTSTTGGVSVTATSGGSTPSGATSTATLPFWNITTFSSNNNNSVISHGFDEEIWSSRNKRAVYSSSLTPLQQRQPSNWSQETILLPINVFVERPSSKQSMVCQFKNSRFLRIDNFEPEQILTLGNEQWIVFPFYRKNSAARDGGSPIDHSGTFGWAIRYEGP